ncbi:MAG: hypothetical protein IJ744_00070 [Lachnospiraceae bacterium]|nr:hypothetical protein [Lachnospiraceae bacterium]
MLFFIILLFLCMRGSFELFRIFAKAFVYLVLFALVISLVGGAFGLIMSVFSTTIRAIGTIPMLILIVIFVDWLIRKKREGQTA